MLPKATYHDERKRIANPHDKYAKAKKMILQIAQRFKARGRWTAGYRRIQAELDKMELHLSGDTIRKLMSELNVQVSLYNRHRNGKYSSYHGTVGKIAANKLNQEFNAHQPYQVIHTDVTQVRLANHHWAYISVMIDEASQEILAFQLSTSPNKELIMLTLEELIDNLPDGAQPTIHSDQGWHYQFQLSNYNGGVNITGLPAGYEIVDSNGNVVNQVQSGQTYRVKYVGSGNPSSTTVNNTVNKITAKASYEALKDSNYFSAVMQNAAPGTNNKWQNMVNLETTENTFSFPIIWSSIASSSSTKSSAVSSVKSSSVVKSSSAKSSSVVSSSKKSSSSAKSSSIASSKKSSSSVKSSSVASSKKATATTSSETTKNSSSKATKTISSVASAKKTSSSVSTKAATSSSNNTTSAKKGVVAGVANYSLNSGKGTGHGQGEGHGMPQTGEAVATSLIAAGVVLLASAGAITLRKRN